MIFISSQIKNDPVKRWNLEDEVFFAAGACHILAYAFLELYEEKGFKALWIKPEPGERGNHIFVTEDTVTFDYSGLTTYDAYISKVENFLSPVEFQLVELPSQVLISEAESKRYEGLWLREPKQFLHDALPRARKYLKRFNLNEHIKCGAQFSN